MEVLLRSWQPDTGASPSRSNDGVRWGNSSCTRARGVPGGGRHQGSFLWGVGSGRTGWCQEEAMMGCSQGQENAHAVPSGKLSGQCGGLREWAEQR